MNNQVGVIASYVYLNTNNPVLGVRFVTNIVYCIWLSSNNMDRIISVHHLISNYLFG